MGIKSALTKTRQVLFAKKVFTDETITESKLARVLTLRDLTFLGVSCTLGSGVYITAGQVIQDAGPDAFISFLIAGFCSFLAALSYAELGARVPRSGSAYIYIYVTIGEFIAFVIGWDVIMEYIVGASSVASGLSQYIDSLTDGAIKNAFRESMPINVSNLAPYPDWLAFGITLLMTGILIIGVKESSLMNTVATVLNLCVIVFIVIVGAIKSNTTNWRLEINDNTTWYDSVAKTNYTCAENDCGKGGFVPFGFGGILAGAAQSFYAFIGFDVICTTGEEVQNAKKTIPASILITLLIVSLSYISVTLVMSLMVPYYILDINYPFKTLFTFLNMTWAYYVVSAGAILSLTTCLFSSIYPIPRVVYSMANDRLIYTFLGYVIPKFKTPLIAIVLTGLFAALLALILDLSELVNLTSIGTLLAYALVSSCNLVLRYRPNHYDDDQMDIGKKDTVISYVFGHSEENLLRRMFWPSNKKCTRSSAQLTNIVAVTDVALIIILCIVLSSQFSNLISQLWIIFVAVLLALIAICTFIIFMQPQNDQIDTFKAPLMPFVPLLAVFTNVILLTQLPAETLIRFAIWFALGFFVYITYGMRKSKERVNRNQPVCTWMNGILRCKRKRDDLQMSKI